MTASTRTQPGNRSGAPLIVHAVRQYAPGRGGLEDVVSNLARQSLQRGYRVRVVTCDRLFSMPDRILPSTETIDGIEVVRIPWSGSSRYPFAPQLIRHVSDADLIHVHAIDFFFDALAVRRLFRRQPMVVTTHGGFFHTPKYAAIKKIWFRTLTRMSALAYDKVVCCSRSDHDLFAGIVSPSRLSVIENGVDTGKFADASSQNPKRRIVTIGRFSINKRLERLLDVLKELIRNHPDWHLDIVGVPSDLGEAGLHQEIAARDLERNVSAHIGLENDAICDVISQASFFASASDYEGFGLVAIEAMSAGLLPVLHPNDAFKALSGHHEEIVLADFSDAAATAERFAAAFTMLEQNGEDIRRKLVSDAADYSWERAMDHYAAVYETVLGTASPVANAGLAEVAGR